MNTEQIMALADARAQAVVEASKLYAISILSSRTQDAWDKADEARNSLQAAVEELMQERDALRLVERGMEMTINDLKESRDTYQVAADKLAAECKTLRDAWSAEPVGYISEHEKDSAMDKFRYLPSKMYPTPVYTRNQS